PRLEALEHRDVPSTLMVTTPADTGCWGDGSLRGEILAAASGDQIVFAPSLAGQTITLTSGTELYLAKDLTIQGLGAGLLTVRGCGSRVCEIAPGATDTITCLTVANGVGDTGGGLYNEGTLTLGNCTLSGNAAPAGYGGGVFNTGTLTVNASTLCGNAADNNGGAIFNDTGTLTVSG